MPVIRGLHLQIQRMALGGGGARGLGNGSTMQRCTVGHPLRHGLHMSMMDATVPSAVGGIVWLQENGIGTSDAALLKTWLTQLAFPYCKMVEALLRDRHSSGGAAIPVDVMYFSDLCEGRASVGRFEDLAWQLACSPAIRWLSDTTQVCLGASLIAASRRTSLCPVLFASAAGVRDLLPSDGLQFLPRTERVLAVGDSRDTPEPISRHACACGRGNYVQNQLRYHVKVRRYDDALLHEVGRVSMAGRAGRKQLRMGGQEGKG